MNRNNIIVQICYIYSKGWILPVAAGAAGVIVLSIIIGFCAYCMKQSSGKKYKGEGNTNYNVSHYIKLY
jgi:hypothetical protein